MGSSNIGKPIVIADYDPAWPRMFDNERALIYVTCGRDAFMTIEHMGSTAVPGLAAKPIIDIMPGLRSLGDAAALIPKLASIGYAYVPEFELPSDIDEGMPFRRYFRKDTEGQRSHHMHMVEYGSDFWREHLLFRNWLKVAHDDRDAYARMKRAVAADFNAVLTATSDMNVGYTDRKSELIAAIKAKARERILGNESVEVVEYNRTWPERFEAEHARVLNAIASIAVDVQHVGSTAVMGLSAKPHIDIALGVRTMDEGRSAVDALRRVGYDFAGMRGDGPPDWIVFRRLERGADVAHLHMVPHDGWRWQRYVLFRDYLRAHVDARDRYAELKTRLATEYGRDRLGYSEAKSEFVREVFRLAGAPLYEESWAPVQA